MKKGSIKHGCSHFMLILTQIMTRGEIGQTSIIIAYYILFSIFPVIMIVGNMLPLLQINTSSIATYLNVIFPEQIAQFILPIVKSLLHQQSNGFISLGIIFALWSFSGLVNSIRIAMNKIYGVYEQEKTCPWWYYFVTRTLMLLLSIFMIYIFLLAIFVVAFGNQIMNFLGVTLNFSVEWLNQLLHYRWPLIILMTILFNTYINYTIPNISMKSRITFPGTIFTTICWCGLSYFFGLYLHEFGIRWENYGIIGTFIIFLMWLNLAAILFLIGVCLNATISYIKYGNAQYKLRPITDYLKSCTSKANR